MAVQHVYMPVITFLFFILCSGCGNSTPQGRPSDNTPPPSAPHSQDGCFTLPHMNQSITDVDFADPAVRDALTTLFKNIQTTYRNHDFTSFMPNAHERLQFCIQASSKSKPHEINKSECPFCAIIHHRAGALAPGQRIIDENDSVIAFEKHYKTDHVNFLITPKEHITNIASLDFSHPHQKDVLTNMLAMAQKLAREAKAHGASGAFTLRMNTGKNAGQTVWHLHMHVHSDDIAWF